MIKRILLALVAVVVLGGVAAYALGNPGAAHLTWTRFQAAVVIKDRGRLAELASKGYLEFDWRMRGLALTASEAELAQLPTIDIMSVVGLRLAVDAGELTQKDLETVVGKQGPVASMPSPTIAEMALLFAMPIGSDYLVGWIGPAVHAGHPLALSMAVAFDLRVGFVRDGSGWRLDLMPAIRASAGEHDAIGATAPPEAEWQYRKAAFERLFAHADPLKQRAMWTPVNEINRSAKPR